MANTKISALSSSTTPLAGSEVLPIVQSGATKKVAVSDLTAGRTVNASALGVGVTTPASGITIEARNAAAGTGIRVSNSGGGYAELVCESNATSNAQLNYTNQLTASGGDFKLSGANFVPTTAAKGINFTANTGAAGKTSQLLNWYEEGTFTPVVADAATGGNTGTAALAKGRYTRVGRLITVTIAFLDITTTGMTAGNTLYIRGLPYTSITDAFVNFQGSQSNSQLASTNGAIYPTLGNNSSAIYLLDGVAAGSGTTLKVSAITSGQTDLYITLTYEAA